MNNTSNNYQRHLIRLKGFCDGAGARGMQREYENNADYEKGYVDGQKAKHEYARSAAAEFGVEPREIVLMKEHGA